MFILDHIEYQAQENPSSPVFLFRDISLTYRQLNIGANQIAHHIRSFSIQPDSVVAICCETSLDLPKAVFGAIKAGHPYLLISPDLPKERVDLMLSEAKAKILITNWRWASLFENFRGEIVFLDAQAGVIQNQPADNLERSSNNDLYLVFTSGSTGIPKGLRIPVLQMKQALAWRWQRYPFKRNELTCHKTYLGFVDASFELFEASLQGTPTLLIPHDIVNRPQEFVDLLVFHGVTRIRMVPTYLRLLLNTVPDLADRLPKLWMWTTSGEALPGPLLDQFQQRMPGRTLINVYGLSEVISISAYEVTQDDLNQPRAPVGHPIPGREVLLLDAEKHPVDQGEIGYIYVGGSDIPQGYLNNSDLTKEKFFPNPYPDQAVGKMLFNTGDLGKWTPNGTLDYLGREDTVIKYHGYRIELGEIEFTLEKHPIVKQAVVLGDTSNGKGSKLSIKAFLLTDEDKTDEQDPSEMRSYLQNSLPHYMLPHHFYFVQEYPLTRSGKVNRKALLEPLLDLHKQTEHHEEHLSALEQKLMDQFKLVLKTSSINKTASFFDLGGDSLQAIEFTVWLSPVSPKYPISLPDLIQHPSVESLAAFIEKKNSTVTQPDPSNFSQEGTSSSHHPDLSITEDDSSENSLVGLQPDGPYSPFFCVHGLGGHLNEVNQLADQFSVPFPFWGLQAQGWRDEDKILSSFYRMASCYINELKAVQPNGPYYLGGYSIGGHIAFEIGHQLLEQGDEVALLVIIDDNLTYSQSYWHLLPRNQKRRIHARKILEKVQFHYQNLSSLSMREKLRYINIFRGQTHFALFSDTEIEIGARVQSGTAALIYDAILDGKKEYVLKKYPGECVLIRSSNWGKGVSYGWEDVALGGVQAYEFNCKHIQIMHPPVVSEVAAVIQSHISELENL